MSVKIIAEIGINHNGDLNIAKKLIDIASVAGCDFVKFQKRSIMEKGKRSGSTKFLRKIILFS